MTIGENIARIRKDRNITQADLAKAVNISAQAVSKWENGGVPDTELLPVIADFFEVSLDELFGRDGDKYISLERKVAKAVTELGVGEDRFEKMYNLCWAMEVGEHKDNHCDWKIKNEQMKNFYSSVRSDHGYTMMKLDWDCPYFLLAPDSPNKTKTLLENRESYIELFADLADKEFFDALVFLYQRDGFKQFTAKLLVSNLGIELEKAEAIIAKMKKYWLVRSMIIDLDGEDLETFSFNTDTAFPSLLLFAKEMIDKPSSFYYYRESRNKPYLK